MLFQLTKKSLDIMIETLRKYYPGIHHRVIEHLYLNSGYHENNHRLQSSLLKQPIDPKILQRYHDASAILLATMPKTGTHYIKNMMSNYYNHAYQFHKKEKLSELYKYFLTVLNERQDHSIINQSIYFSHFGIYNNDLKFFSGKKILVYRNPLDQICSFYSMNIKEGHTRTKLNDLYKSYAHCFARTYQNLKQCEQSGESKVIAYESLLKEPMTVLKELIEFIDGESNQASLEYAVNESSIKKFTQYEAEGHKTIAHYKKSHISKVVVGQWKDTLSQRQVQKIEEILASYQLSLDQFICK